MTRLKLTLLVSASALYALACASNTNTATVTNTNRTATVNAASANASAPAASADEFAAARTTYNATCIKCHKESGEGGVAEIDGERLKVPSLKSHHAREHTDAELVKKISKGGEGMPAFEKRLTPDQISGLARFVRHEFQSTPETGGASNTNAAATNANAGAHK
ncbi:MAG: Cytochrome oxidase, cbb3-type, subunit [Acidobacteriota bacterium]|nr:Cytochrome oxidase, cbb3-type, subunit [Acidobacteriota bacterium]